jgi:hypothetical protein
MARVLDGFLESRAIHSDLGQGPETGAAWRRLMWRGLAQMPPISLVGVNHKVAHHLSGIIYGQLPYW